MPGQSGGEKENRSGARGSGAGSGRKSSFQVQLTYEPMEIVDVNIEGFGRRAIVVIGAFQGVEHNSFARKPDRSLISAGLAGFDLLPVQDVLW